MLSVLFFRDQPNVYGYETNIIVCPCLFYGQLRLLGLHAVYTECPGIEPELSYLGNQTCKLHWNYYYYYYYRDEKMSTSNINRKKKSPTKIIKYGRI
jgi:hypothetical protein